MDPMKTIRIGVFLRFALLVIQYLAAVDTSQTNADEGKPAKAKTNHANANPDRTTTGKVKGNSVEAQVENNATALRRKMENVRIDDIDKNYASITIADWPPTRLDVRQSEMRSRIVRTHLGNER